MLCHPLFEYLWMSVFPWMEELSNPAVSELQLVDHLLHFLLFHPFARAEARRTAEKIRALQASMVVAAAVEDDWANPTHCVLNQPQ